MTLYMEITKDIYELPVAVADSVTELAMLTGKHRTTIWKDMKQSKKCKYIKVEIEEGEE